MAGGAVRGKLHANGRFDTTMLRRFHRLIRMTAPEALDAAKAVGRILPSVVEGEM